MNNHINIENYEAYYLDYLEGNLGEADLAAFEAFLGEHPELRIDEDFAPVIVPEEQLDGFNKLLLKKHVPVTELSAESFDFFLISYTEGLLSESDKTYFLSWVNENPEFAGELSFATRAKLQADNSLVFSDKASLHQTKIHVLPIWWAMGAVAAGLAILITLNLGGTIDQQGKEEVAQKAEKLIEQNTSGNNDSSGTLQKEAVEDETPVYNASSAGKNDSSGKVNIQKMKNPGEQKKDVPALDPRRASVEKDPQVLADISVNNTSSGNEAAAPQTVARSGDNLVNPIKPVTQTLSAKLDTPIDFKKGKATKDRRGGFYVKIGKLEVSHTTASIH